MFIANPWINIKVKHIIKKIFIEGCIFKMNTLMIILNKAITIDSNAGYLL